MLADCKQCEGSGKIEHSLPFNPESSDQVADVLYRGLGIKPRRFKGKESVKASLLDAISDKHPLVPRIITFSQHLADYETTERLSADFDGRLHCIFDPWGTASGRVGGKEGLVQKGTNPMNIPKPARRFVVPDAGHVLLYPDMNAIEARCVALLSKDRRFMSSFTDKIDWPGNERHGKIDPHTFVMQLMLREEGIEINRDGQKRLTYATMYGGGASQVAKEINAEMYRKKLPIIFTVDQIDRAQKAMFRIFPGLREYQQSVLDEVFSTKRLRCPFTGRERTWNERVGDRKTGKVNSQIAKQIWSALPQNMAAWVLALGLTDLYYNAPSGVYGELLQPLIHVHDALLFQAPLDKQELAKSTAISYLSRNVWGMDFPSEMKTGANWYEAS
jgi:DNA polymerase I-like protein with 3'-5' exonuclease and polymerase domains